MDYYWKAILKILFCVLTIWFIVSFGFGILLSDWLDQFRIGGFKLGFWFAKKGSIYFFILLIFTYVFLMGRLDKKFSAERDKKDSQ